MVVRGRAETSGVVLSQQQCEHSLACPSGQQEGSALLGPLSLCLGWALGLVEMQGLRLRAHPSAPLWGRGSVDGASVPAPPSSACQTKKPASSLDFLGLIGVISRISVYKDQ